MHTHPNARLTPIGREWLVRRHIDDAVPLAALASYAGIGLRSAYKWLILNRSGGVAALMDRHSMRSTHRRRLDQLELQRAVDLRHERCTAIWRSITAAGATWPWQAASRFSGSVGSGLLNDLVRKHT
jgi:hypothetical protein